MASDDYIHSLSDGAQGGPLLLVFHGTGGDENQFFGLGRDLLAGATVVAPRGDVSEHGSARYFRRTAEGVYDMDDLARATARMTGFVRAWKDERKPSAVIGLGYSNGANILASVLFSAPGLFDAAVLMHPLIPFEPKAGGSLAGTRVLITAGRHDPICPPPLTQRLEATFRGLAADVELVWHDGGHDIREAEILAADAFLTPYR